MSAQIWIRKPGRAGLFSHWRAQMRSRRDGTISRRLDINSHRSGRHRERFISIERVQKKWSGVFVERTLGQPCQSSHRLTGLIAARSCVQPLALLHAPPRAIRHSVQADAHCSPWPPTCATSLGYKPLFPEGQGPSPLELISSHASLTLRLSSEPLCYFRLLSSRNRQAVQNQNNSADRSAALRIGGLKELGGRLKKSDPLFIHHMTEAARFSLHGLL